MKKVLFVGFEPSYIHDVLLRFDNIESCILVPGNSTKVAAVNSDKCFLLNDETIPKNDKRLGLFLSHVPVFRIIDSDRILRRRRYKESYKFVEILANAICHFVEKFKPDLIFSTYDNAHSYLSYYVAEYYGMKWGAYYFTAIPKGYVTIAKSIHDVRRLHNFNSEVDENIVHSIFNKIITKNNSVHYYKKKSLGFAYIKKAKKLLSPENGYNRMLWPTAYERVQDDLKEKFQHIYLQKKYDKTHDLSGDYVVYFLQLNPESTVDVWANESRDQVTIVKNLRKALPLKTRLVVKIHPSDPSGLSISAIKSLSSVNNVSLVTKSSSLDLIENSLFIATVTGTPALEAFILGKQALMFGRHPYNDFTGVHYFNSGNSELEQFIERILEKKPLDIESRKIEFSRWLKKFRLGRLNDWSVKTEPAELSALQAIILDYIKEDSAKHH